MSKLKIVFPLILICFYTISFAQINQIDSNKTFYWFKVKAKVKIDKKTKKAKFVLKTINKKISSGRTKDYEKSFYRSAIKGKYVIIGPFFNKKHAQKVMPLYNLSNYTDTKMEREIDDNTNFPIDKTFYWFYLKLEHKRSPIFRRTYARISEGNMIEFRTILWEGTYFKQITFGPFCTEAEAKLAKELARIEN